MGACDATKIFAFWTAQLSKSILASDETFRWHENWHFFSPRSSSTPRSRGSSVYVYTSKEQGFYLWIYLLVLGRVSPWKRQEEKKGGIYMNRFCSAINLSSFITACFAREEIRIKKNNQLHAEHYLPQNSREIYEDFQLEAEMGIPYALRLCAIINDCMFIQINSTYI